MPTLNSSAYTRLTIANDVSPSGIFDPYPVYATADSAGWMAYSGVFFYSSGGNLVQDVVTDVAKSTDHGTTWTFVQPVATPTPVAFTQPNTTLCGATVCNGHLISEVPFLVDDASDPNPATRWKMFAHRYFLYPPGQASGKSLLYVEGAIWMQTAASPDGAWSGGAPVLRWPSTAPEISGGQDISAMSGLSSCVVLSEGAGIARAGELDLLFACVYDAGGGNYAQKIVELKSVDHGASFSFVGDVLQPSDGAALGGADVTAPAIAWDGSTARLLVTALTATGAYAGCGSVDLDLDTATVTRSGSAPAWRKLFPTQGGVFGGACAWAPGATANGVLIVQLQTAGNPADPFRIFATHADP